MMLLATQSIIGQVQSSRNSPDLIQSEEKKKELTEEQKLKAENLKLKIQIAQLRSWLQERDNELNEIKLTSEQKKLIEEFRKQLNADEKDTFDWNTLTFSKPAK